MAIKLRWGFNIATIYSFSIDLSPNSHAIFFLFPPNQGDGYLIAQNDHSAPLRLYLKGLHREE